MSQAAGTGLPAQVLAGALRRPVRPVFPQPAQAEPQALTGKDSWHGVERRSGMDRRSGAFRGAGPDAAQDFSRLEF